LNNRAESGAKHEREERVTNDDDAGDVEELRLDVETQVYGTAPPIEEWHECSTENADHHSSDRQFVSEPAGPRDTLAPRQAIRLVVDLVSHEKSAERQTKQTRENAKTNNVAVDSCL
jgi:hypothetical protein